MQQRPYGNLFARKLQQVLAAHGHDLAWLTTSLGISQDTLTRLQRSLHMPSSFPVLDAETLERLQQTLPLTSDEHIHLQASLLATEFQRALDDYLDPENALAASEQLLPFFEKTLHTGQAKRADDDHIFENTELDRSWQALREALDSATLTLKTSYHASYKTRVRKIKEALTEFQSAANGLQVLGNSARSLHLWKEYHQEARRGIKKCTELLEELGES